jgi:hypothetical protein
VISPKVVHLTCGSKLNESDYLDIRALFAGIRSAIDATDNAYDVVQHTTGFKMDSSKKRVIKTMAEAVVAQIV